MLDSVRSLLQAHLRELQSVFDEAKEKNLGTNNFP